MFIFDIQTDFSSKLQVVFPSSNFQPTVFNFWNVTQKKQIQVLISVLET